ncbi:MAG: hypothetical protein R3183_05505 [Oleiphilaceae bacterium]|nr:hypothetical protein [Oleiphilaceae bacterium]
MLENICKLIFALTLFFTGVFASRVFGVNAGLMVLLAVSALVLASIYVTPLKMIARAVAALVCVLSALAFVLLMLAGTIGGSFHLSESSQAIAFMLVLISLTALPLFVWRT